MTTDALMSELRIMARVEAAKYSALAEDMLEWKAADTLSRLTRELAEARERADRFEKLDREAATHVETVICMRTGFTGDPPYVGWKGLGLALTEALDERDKALAELAKKDGWVRVPIEVENACMNWLANRIQGNGHGEDIELGRLMRGLQTYIKAVADGTNK